MQNQEQNQKSLTKFRVFCVGTSFWEQATVSAGSHCISMWRYITSPRVAPLELNPLFVGGNYKQAAPTELKSWLLKPFN